MNSPSTLADPPKPAPDDERQPSQRLTVQPKLQFIVFSIIILATFYIARGFLLPVFAALLLSYALVPAVRLLVKLHIPRIVSAFLVVVIFFSGSVYVIIALSGPAIAWLEKAPESFQKFEGISQVLKRPVENVNAATEELNKMTQGESKGREPIVVRIQDSNALELVLSQTPIIIGAAISTLLLLFFLLAFGNLLLKKAVEISPDLDGKRRAVETARLVENSVSSYLVTVTMINATLGLIIGTSFYFLDFPNPILWGTLAALFNFIPYLGALTGVCFLTFASLATFPDPETALIYPALYLALTMIEGNFVTPMILGQSFMINPIFIILVLLFLGWLWGIPGAVMAVPILVAIKSSASNFERTRPLATILSK